MDYIIYIIENAQPIILYLKPYLTQGPKNSNRVRNSRTRNLQTLSLPNTIQIITLFYYTWESS